MRTKLIYMCGWFVLIGLIFQGILGVTIALLLSGLIGSGAGIYKRDRSIWIPSLIVFIAATAFVIVFIWLLRHSNM